LSPLQILALDTTTRGGSVAVVRDGAVIAERTGDPALTHGQRLPADIAAVLDVARLSFNEVDLLAVAAGPGSFTGLRVGIATVQGLAVARGLEVVPVPTLEALARSLETDRPYDAIAAWMDGQRGEIFGALYDRDGHELVPAIAGHPERVLEEWHHAGDRSLVFIGDGAVRYRPLLEQRFGAAARVIASGPLAATIGRIAFAEPRRAVPPNEITPIYVRRPDAELARERRRAATLASPVQNREPE
jgi:tRNA threonylcarbamoyladenosine biosynthesis protein TsaB